MMVRMFFTVGVDPIQVRFQKLAPFLDERMRRLVAAAESVALGLGGTTKVSRATGVSRRAIGEGVKELALPPVKQKGRIRRRVAAARERLTPTAR